MRARRRLVALGVLVAWIAVLAASAPGRTAYLLNDDHGFQLALGKQVLFGKTPGVDAFNAYGPLVVYASALGQWLTGSLVGEGVTCVLGYGLALGLIHALVARHASIASGLLASTAAFLLLSRFYKWYLWLWPLLVLWALSRTLAAPPGVRARRALLLGVVLGLEWLHRLDVGTLGLAGAFAAIVLATPRPRRGEVPRALGALAAGFALPLAAWLGYVLARHGPDGVAYFFRSTLAGAFMVQSGMRTDFPAFRLGEPFSAANARVVAYVALPAAYLVWAVQGLAAAFRDELTPRRGLLLAAAVAGASVLHQALHRKDGQHLLQVLAPAFVGAFVWGEGLVRSLAADLSARRVRPGRLAGIALLAALVLGGVGHAGFGREDLVPPTAPVGRWRGLAHPLGGGPQPKPFLEPLRRVVRWTGPDDAVLAFPLFPQAYAFTDRRMSGKLHGYYPGAYDRPPWSEDALEAIRADPPVVVIATPDLIGREGARGERWRRYRAAHDHVDRWIRERYTEVLYADPWFVLLRRPAPGGGGGRGAGDDDGRAGRRRMDER